MTLCYYKVMFQLSMFFFFNTTTILGWYQLAFKRKATRSFKILFLKWFCNIGIDTGDFKNQKSGSNAVLNSNRTLILMLDSVFFGVMVPLRPS